MKVRIRDVVTAASEVFGINRDDIMSGSRVGPIVMARKAAYLAARMEGHSFPEIGRIMDREHSTVKHGVNSARWYYDRDPEYAAKIADIRAKAKVMFRPVARIPSHLERMLAEEARKRKAAEALRFLDDTERDHHLAMKRGSAALLEALRAAA